MMSSDNWNRIVGKYGSLIGRQYKDEKGKVYSFFGLVHGDDDFYFGMAAQGDLRLLSCVGTPETMGLELI